MLVAERDSLASEVGSDCAAGKRLESSVVVEGSLEIEVVGMAAVVHMVAVDTQCKVAGRRRMVVQ